MAAQQIRTSMMHEGFNFQKVWKSYGIIAILVIFFIVLSVATDSFLTVSNLINILRQISILGIVALGLFTTMVSGNIDLSVGSTLGFSSALWAALSFSIGIVPALIVTILASLLIGWLNGFFSTRSKGLSIMVTLSMKFIIFSGTLLITGTKPIVNLPESLLVLGKNSVGPLPIPVIILVVMVFFGWVFMSHTVVGRKFYAVGSNAVAAKFSGLRVKRVQIISFIITALASTLAGIILMGRVTSAQPNAGFGIEMDAIGAVLLGGASLNGGSGTIRGTVIGVLILGLIANGLNLLGVNPLLRDGVKGAIILLAILIDQWGRE
jgi:ribose transport system permease protein